MDRLYASRCGVCAADQRQDIARFLLSDRVLVAILRRIQGGFNVREEIDPDLFKQAKEMLDEAIGQSFDLRTEWGKEDLAFIAELRHNAEVFAAFKAHREQNDLAALLLDEEGKPRSFDVFRKAAEPVIGQYNVNWLRTEYTAAIRNARTARRFRAYQKDADLFPNLRWLKSRAAEPRFSHRQYYNTIRRIDDPWWLTHYPGCVWNCQCDMEQTADPITHVGDTPVMPGQPSTKPGSEGDVRAPGLSQNPALSKSLFSQDHPYFTAAYPGAKEAVEKSLHEYNPDSDYGKRLMVSTKADQTEVIENVRAAKAILGTFPNTNIKIREHVRAYGVKNPEYEIDGLIADRKGVMSEKGISDGFSKAIKQGCKAVIIDFDMHMSEREIKYREVAKRLIWRREDFESNRIVRCYIIKNKRAICLDKHQLDKNILMELFKKLEP